ncbi:hypothetical protein [Antarctobacter jejuensis]|uniref:hypothetical protein n=1 Tax=Antarctobacter jejuensis TaxID=1439938 RepID=UPI003FD412B4
MEQNVRPEDCTVAVLSQNALETTDLTEFFEDRGAGPVFATGDPGAATRLLQEGRLRPGLTVFGFPLHDARADVCWQGLRRLRLPTILLDGVFNPAEESSGIFTLSRPFTTADLESALAQLGQFCGILTSR